MDAAPHPHANWADYRNQGVDWWWDTPWGPDGNGRHTGPSEDDKRPALVLNSGLTREQYRLGDFVQYIKEAKECGPTDVWADAWPTNRLYTIEGAFNLCLEDTLPEERDELDRRGFTYLGTRGDCIYFRNPNGKLPDMKWNGLIDVTYPDSGVRLIIQRGYCMCSTYHRTHDAWYWSRVAFDGKPARPPPVAPPSPPPPPPPTPEEIAEQEAFYKKHPFWAALRNVKEAWTATANAEVVRALMETHKFQQKWAADHVPTDATPAVPTDGEMAEMVRKLDERRDEALAAVAKHAAEDRSQRQTTEEHTEDEWVVNNSHSEVIPSMGDEEEVTKTKRKPKEEFYIMDDPESGKVTVVARYTHRNASWVRSERTMEDEWHDQVDQEVERVRKENEANKDAGNGPDEWFKNRAHDFENNNNP